MSDTRETEIDRIIDVLKRVWKRCPELRLGQLVESALVNSEESARRDDHCIFYVKDDDMYASLQTFEARFCLANDQKDQQEGADDVTSQGEENGK